MLKKIALLVIGGAVGSYLTCNYLYKKAAIAVLRDAKKAEESKTPESTTDEKD